MSLAEAIQSATLRRCPPCGGEMQPGETICSQCRSELENEVMGVRAADYPPPAKVVRVGAATSASDGVIGSGSIEARLGSTVDNDVDLLPLSPLDDQAGSADADAAIERPAPPPTPVEMDTPARALQATSSWKPVVIVLAITLAAALAAALLWEKIIPPAPVSEAGSTPAPSLR